MKKEKMEYVVSMICPVCGRIYRADLEDHNEDQLCLFDETQLDLIKEED